MALNQYLRPFSLLLVLATTSGAVAQNCSCGSDICCSQYGYCGTTEPYCGAGCQQGPCSSPPSISSIVTDNFFNGIINQADSTCAGKTFYDRSAFLTAVESFSSFGTTGSQDVQKREIAAFFAHVTDLTGYFCYIEQIDGASNRNCDSSYTEWPCNPNKKYYGRGPMQMAWNYNYGPAGKSIGFDGLNSPETVANDAVISFKTALWFWMSNVHFIITSGQGFGATIRALNSVDCDGGDTSAADGKAILYNDYCQQLGVDPGSGVGCNDGNSTPAALWLLCQ